jgi:hypothetical protein
VPRPPARDDLGTDGRKCAMSDYAEKISDSERDSAQMDKRLAELDINIERLKHMTEVLGKQMQSVLRPADPSDPRAELATAMAESPLAEHIASASRQVEAVASRLGDLMDRCDL